MEYSVSEENYIKTIFHLQQKQGKVTTNELANHLKTRPSSITDMLKKLKKRNLVHYQPYQGFKLSIPGKKAAIEIIRRHRGRNAGTAAGFQAERIYRPVTG